MLLNGKNAVIYGAGGSIGGAVARAFAKHGANLFLTGRTEQSVNKVAEDIRDSGGSAEVAVVDALQEEMIEKHADSVVQKAGTIDISFNAVGFEDDQGTPLLEMTLENFIRPIDRAIRTLFMTTTATGRVMKKQGSGVIMTITASPAGKAYSLVGGFGPACSAIEGFSRNLASELGPFGVRVVNIRSGGSPDSRPFTDALGDETDLSKTFLQPMLDDTMLKRLPYMADIGDVAVFLASNMSRAMTGTSLNVTCGTTRD